jgi:hypothetical protein
LQPDQRYPLAPQGVHSWHTVLPLNPWYSPAPHPRHPEFAPVTDVYEPALHLEQTVAAWAVWNVPAAQSEHADAPALGEIAPAGHARQLAAEEAAVCSL